MSILITGLAVLLVVILDSYDYKWKQHRKEQKNAVQRFRNYPYKHFDDFD